jgi:crotonobetainyl-CoA:carnitine CoA-transferase CaiB-like acyl-CoA transferase
VPSEPLEQQAGNWPYAGVKVIDLSSGIAGGYATKLLSDAGASVAKVEDPSGDPLRTRKVYDEDGELRDSPLFSFLSSSKRSIVATTSATDVERLVELVGRADVVVWSPGSQLAADPRLDPRVLHDLAPATVVTAITPFGLSTSWCSAPAGDLTMQAWGGGMALRGDEDGPPLSVGGDHSEWMGGMFAAASTLIGLHRARRWGLGDLVDSSTLEALVLTQSDPCPVTYGSIAGRPWHTRRWRNVPDVERTADGYVGFMVVTAQMFADFCAMIERPDWAEQPDLFSHNTRRVRRAELQPVIAAWMSARTSAEIIELASLLRIPVAPIGNGRTVTAFDQMIEYDFFVPRPAEGFVQPTVPYRLRGASVSSRPFEPPPKLGEHGTPLDELRHPRRGRQRPTVEPPQGSSIALPFAGLRVLDFTAFWAGPLVGATLAKFGAEVIHVESTNRLDGSRGNSAKLATEDLWWEWAPTFHGVNTGKLGITLDMGSTTGRELARRLIAKSDVIVENLSPRVFDSWDLGYPEVKRIRPDIIMVRMPAFGLAGPWRNRTGYAQTMEQVSGLAWLTGLSGKGPTTVNGPCDPIAGVHALIALLAGLEHRRRSGEGMLIEVPMVASALNVAAEQVLVHSATGALLGRRGNHGAGAPQGVYLSADIDDAGGRDCWVAIAVLDDIHWKGLCEAIGDRPPGEPGALVTADQRRLAHDELDEWISAWCATRDSRSIVAELRGAGVPAAIVMRPCELAELTPLQERRFFEVVEHPITGSNLREGYPARFAGGPERVSRAPSPTLGQHTNQVLGDLLGITDQELSDLESRGVIGTRPRGVVIPR